MAETLLVTPGERLALVVSAPPRCCAPARSQCCTEEPHRSPQPCPCRQRCRSCCRRRLFRRPHPPCLQAEYDAGSGTCVKDKFICATLVGSKRVLPAGEGEAEQVRQSTCGHHSSSARTHNNQQMGGQLQATCSTRRITSAPPPASPLCAPCRRLLLLLLLRCCSGLEWRSSAAAWSRWCRVWETQSPRAWCASTRGWRQVRGMVGSLRVVGMHSW